MTEHKLDVFELLKEIDKGNYDYFDNLTQEQINSFSPLVVMRWMSGTDDEKQILRLNTILNPRIFNLAKHKELLYKTLCVCSSKKYKRYTWMKVVNAKKNENGNEILQIIAKYYSTSIKDSKQIQKIITVSDFVSILESLGYQPDEIKKYKKMYKQ